MGTGTRGIRGISGTGGRLQRRFVWSFAAVAVLVSCTVFPVLGSREDLGGGPGAQARAEARVGEEQGPGPGRDPGPRARPGEGEDAGSRGGGPGTSASAAGRSLPPLGVFTGSGPEGVRRLSDLQAWLGGTDLRVGHTYLPGETWAGIEGPPGFLAPWARWRRADPGRLFVLNVPMQARDEAGVSDARVRKLLREGAEGHFDAHFRTLAKRLVRLRVPDTVLVLGWEMNGSTYTHRCGPDPKTFKRYWRRVVGVMRSVPGQRFTFDFAPARGADNIGWTSCYPGDDVVDIIGMDAYDQPAGLSFTEQVREPFGLQAQVDFAAKHKKPISYPEWGLFRNGDDPEYVRRMLEWFKRHKPLYQTLSDYCPHGVWQCKKNPNSSETYRAALFGLTGSAPVPPQAPTQPRPPKLPVPPRSPKPPREHRPWYERCVRVGDVCFRFDRLSDWWD
jgi:hypothetical protein